MYLKSGEGSMNLYVWSDVTELHTKALQIKKLSASKNW